MGKGVKIIVAVIATLLLLSGLTYWFVFTGTEIDMKPLIKNEEIVFSDLDDKLYLRAMSWGVAGNHNEVIISNSPINPIDRKSEKEADFIFYTTEIYYKKQSSDTLLVYAEGSSIGKNPKGYLGKVKVVINPLKTYNDSKEYAENYAKYGLKKLSAYQE